MMIQFLPPQFKTIERVLLVEDDEFELIKKLVASFWDGTTAQDVASMVFNRQLDCWITKDRACLILTETVDRRIGRELFLYGIAGRGILKNKRAVLEDLEQMAAYLGCQFIGAMGIPRGWERVAKATGFAPVATQYLKRLTHGQ